MAQSYFSILLISPFWGGCNPSFHYNWTPPLPNDTLYQVWLKLAKWFFSRRFLNDVNELSLCGYYLPLEKCMALKLAKWFLSSRFLNGVNEIPLCGYYLRLKKCMALKFHKSDYLYPRILCVMFGWNWPSGSGEDFQKFFLYSICCYYLPLEKGQVPSFKINLIPLTQGCSMPSLVKFGLVVLEKKLSDSMYFHFVDIITLWQRA